MQNNEGVALGLKHSLCNLQTTQRTDERCRVRNGRYHDYEGRLRLFVVVKVDRAKYGLHGVDEVGIPQHHA